MEKEVEVPPHQERESHLSSQSDCYQGVRGVQWCQNFSNSYPQELKILDLCRNSPNPKALASKSHFIFNPNPGGSDGKGSPCKAGDPGSILGLGAYSGEGNGHPLQYSCLEISRDRGAGWDTGHGVTQSQTRLSDWHTRPRAKTW